MVQKEIEKVENVIKREKAILKNIDDITAVLEHIAELVESGKDFQQTQHMNHIKTGRKAQRRKSSLTQLLWKQ